MPRGPDTGAASDFNERRSRHDRRRHSMTSFVRGNFRPRRRNVRRQTEVGLGYLDWHESRLLYLAVAIVLLSCLDALFTLNLMSIGASEANVVMNSVLGRGVPYFLAFKFSLTGLGVILLVIAAHRSFFGWFRVIRLLQLICVGYLVLIAYEIHMFDSILGLFGPGALGWRAIFS